MKKEKLKVSIIIPVYKVEPYIEQCINSVLAQTYRQLEVILVDDCTPDHSMEIAEECIRTSNCNDLEFKYLKHNHNCGLSVARNTGIKAATGEFVYLIDSDDWIIPECIELMVKCVEQYPEAEVVYAGAISRWPLSLEKKKLPDYSDDRNWINKVLLCGGVFNGMAWNKLVRRSFIMEYKLFFEILPHEDDIWHFEMAKHVSKIAVCKHDTYNYVIHEGGFMHDLYKNLSKMYHYRIVEFKYLINHITDLFRKRQITHITRLIQAVFPKAIPEEYKDDMLCILSRLSKESTVLQKLTLWLYIKYPNISFIMRKAYTRLSYSLGY